MSNILAQKAVLASLSISRWSARRFDKKVTDEIHVAHNAQSDVGRYNKRLVAKNAMTDLNSIVTTARNYHYANTQPWLDDGARVLPSALFLEYAERMRTLRCEFEAGAAEFCAKYPQVVAEAKVRMNGLFDARDYPDPARIDRFFAFDLAILPCPDTDDFRIALTDDNVEDIRRDVESRMNSVLETSLRDSAERIVETIGHMSERLHAYKPGTKKGDKAEGAFRDSLVDNVRELVKPLRAFNMTGNAKLDDVIARIEGQLCKATPDELRDSAATRDAAAANADAILADVREFLA